MDTGGNEACGRSIGDIAELVERAGTGRLDALLTAISTVRRGGTLSITGVYGGSVDPLPMGELFDKQVQIRMGQANVKRWVDELMPHLAGDDDPLCTEDLDARPPAGGRAARL